MPTRQEGRKEGRVDEQDCKQRRRRRDATQRGGGDGVEADRDRRWPKVAAVLQNFEEDEGPRRRGIPCFREWEIPGDADGGSVFYPGIPAFLLVVGFAFQKTETSILKMVGLGVAVWRLQNPL